ncbi:MAG: PAS domain S-box protein [bacterium]
MNDHSKAEGQLLEEVQRLRDELREAREQAERCARKEAALSEEERNRWRSRAEANQSLLTDILQILNRGGDLHALIADTLRSIRKSSGFDAVGLRLRQGEDYPYFEYDGFSEEFLQKENFLCERGGDGAIVRDADGRAVLECTCGLVLSGRTDPTMTCFTTGGSFWTNSSPELLALPLEADPRTHPRNRCIHAGYDSVGLFPIRSGKEVLGLLQLNGRRSGLFASDLIAFYETLAQNIGLALQRAVAEEALRLSEEKFVLAFANNPAAISLTRLADGLFLDVNDTWVALNGYTREEAIGHSIRTMRIWPSVEDNKRFVEELKDKGSIPGWEQEFHKKSGEVFVAQLSAQVLSVRGEKLILSTLVDITERKRAEQALRESEERLRLAWEATRDVIWDWDVENDAQRWSSAGAEVFGWTDAVEAPQTAAWWSERVHPDDRLRVAEGFHRVLDDASRHQWKDEYRFLRRNGSVANVLDRGFVLRDASGKPKRMIGSMQDITERKAAEEALRQSREDLDRAQEVGQIGWWRLDTQRNALTWSDENHRIFGVPKGTPLTYEAFLDTVHPDDRQYVDSRWKAGPSRRALRYRAPNRGGWAGEMGPREGLPRVRLRGQAARRLRNHSGYH